MVSTFWGVTILGYHFPILYTMYFFSFPPGLGGKRDVRSIHCPAIFLVLCFIALLTCIPSNLWTDVTASGISSVHMAFEDDAVDLMVVSPPKWFAPIQKGYHPLHQKAAAPWSLPFDYFCFLLSSQFISVWTVLVAFQSCS